MKLFKFFIFPVHYGYTLFAHTGTTRGNCYNATAQSGKYLILNTYEHVDNWRKPSEIAPICIGLFFFKQFLINLIAFERSRLIYCDKNNYYLFNIQLINMLENRTVEDIWSNFRGDLKFFSISLVN